MSKKNRMSKVVHNNNTTMLNGTAEYDLQSRLKRLEPYNTRLPQATITNINIQNYNLNSQGNTHSLDSNNRSDSSNEKTETESGYKLSFWYRLDDKISSLSTNNNREHNELRSELEAKIQTSKTEIENTISEIKLDVNSRLSKQWYVWTIIGLTAIVGVFITFSYIPLNNRVSSCENKIDRLDSCEHVNKKDIEYIKIEQLDINEMINNKNSKLSKRNI